MKTKPLYKRITGGRFLLIQALISCLGLTGCGACSNRALGDSSRLQIVNEPLALDTSVAGYGTTVMSEVHAKTLIIPTISLIGTIVGPNLPDGTVLQANDVTMAGTKVYVAYNVAGNVQAGGIDVIDVTVPTAPALTSSIIFPDMDVNKVYVNGSNLFTAGAIQNIGANIREVPLTLGNVGTTYADTYLPSYAGTSITGFGNYLYALSGSNGGLSVFNLSTMALLKYTASYDARDMGVNGAGTVYVVSGANSATSKLAQIHEFTSAGNASLDIDLTGGDIAQSKSTLVVGTNLSIAADGGTGGVNVVCNGNGAKIANIPALGAIPSLSLTAAQTVTNAAAFVNGLLITSNGEAGVYIYSVNQGALLTGTTCYQPSFTLLGSVDFGTAISANNVYTNGNFLFVATGTGGFKIVKVLLSSTVGLLTSL